MTSHPAVTLDGLDDSGLHKDLLTMQSTPLASELDTSLSTYSGINMASTSMTLPSDHTPAISISECGRSCSLQITDLMQDELYETPKSLLGGDYAVARSTNFRKKRPVIL